MQNIRYFLFLLFMSSLISAQQKNEVIQFNNTLNQFLNVRDFCISQDGKEAFFTVQSPFQELSQIAYITKENKTWSEPILLTFGDSFMYLEPFLAADGKRLYFVSDRPLNETETEKKDFDIWYVERENSTQKWSKPKNIGKPVNSELDEFYPSISDNNNLYFTMVSPNGLGKDDIYYCQWKNGSYSNPILLDENINSVGYEFNAFISKKEDFLLFTKYNEKDGFGSGDLYISKKDANGNWQKATNLGMPINTKFMEYCPFYDEKNELFYFTSKRNNLVSKEFKTLSDFQKYLTESDNGLSKIYVTKLTLK